MDPRLVAPTLTAALQLLQHHATRGFTFVRADGTDRFLSFAELLVEANARARGLQDRGYVQGDRVALILPEGSEFVVTLLGAIIAGVVPVPIYPQLTFKNLDTYHDTVGHILVASGARGLLTCATTKPFLDAIATKHALEFGITTSIELRVEGGTPHAVSIAPTDLCFLQFTSGSTAKPKGVEITHRNVAWNAESFMIHGLGVISGSDKGVSWLPLFHDMGLIGFVMGPLFADIEVVFLPTASFVRAPRMWLELISRHRATISYAPNFAYQLVAKRLKDKDVEGLDLSRWRHAGSGAEPIQPRTLREFAGKLAGAGFCARSFLPSYGMAESTLAITFSEMRGLPGEPIFGLRTDVIDAAQLQAGVAVAVNASAPPAGVTAQEIVNCGRAFPAHEIAIVAEDGSRLPDRTTGQIIARGPSISPGYYQDAEKTKQTFRDGWLYTGDLGYLVNGELFICGRLKDMLIIRGRNFYPSDIEWAVGDLARVRRGNVVAFGVDVDGDEQLAVLAEAFQSDSAGLTEEIAAVINAQFSLTPHVVQLVGQGSLPRTSSGKPQRSKTKQMYQVGAFAVRDKAAPDKAAPDKAAPDKAAPDTDN
jgi:fatty-acyl-CoA synthase